MKKLKVFQLLLSLLSIGGWALAVYALLIFDQARPDRAVGYYLSKGASVRLSWDPTMTLRLEYVIWTCAAISLLSLALNYYAAHHSRLGYWFNIPLLLLSSLAAGLYISFLV
ncbi:hypothetical protein [Shewanella colwelliana]|uniref:Uncharacterized protein n=1 Tax=Shewanella colwelliana TaxID=23 RepID=A0A1E5IPJ8_SHECO|nr:hypothetical protein [Shewanella colwelliana]MCZ4338086.1 hypothetical protein [Shewanella colwelliana]MDX1280909.1 hypothetical protein [Shewanella colwelliana]OEG72410.1 hypothetical protein BEL05_05410 [Shewanella colwelliana]GIU28217.1 hypothetical protein TUM4644_25710 [Shewanella colwelliana]GIU34455.1 hypothetical protein TUM3794_00780 [Shewanella colwelliana]